jgi:hypothetical protein
MDVVVLRERIKGVRFVVEIVVCEGIGCHAEQLTFVLWIYFFYLCLDRTSRVWWCSDDLVKVVECTLQDVMQELMLN